MMDAWGEEEKRRAERLSRAIKAALESLEDQDISAVYIILKTALANYNESQSS